MFNPYSAVDRIKNQLAYRLGHAIVNNKQGSGGYIKLIYKLYKIKREYFLQRKIYNQVTKAFPQLKYPKLEDCKDYDEGIKYTHHLSYMIGKVLIQAHNNWHKGGYFFLYRNIIQVNKDYSVIKKFYKDIIKLKIKEKFYKNYNLIKEVLYAHKDYKPIIDNILYNFDFFLQNFTLIEEWLLSDAFYQKYKKNNHPYPSLLDPAKLTVENKDLNYKNISPETAWKINLPIPSNYDFIWLLHAATGNMALILFLKLLKIRFYLNPWISPEQSYKNMYNFYMENREKSAVLFFSRFDQGYEKIMYLVQKEVDVFIVARDPISLVRHLLNHVNAQVVKNNITENMKKVNMTYSFKFPKIFNLCSQKEYPEVSSCEKLFKDGLWIKKHFDEFYFTNQARINIFSRIAKNIECLEFDDIGYSNAFATFSLLAKKYNLYIPKDPRPFQGRVNFSNGDLLILPIVCYIHPHDLNKEFFDDDTSFALEGGVEIIITTHQLHPNKNGFVDITKEIFDDRKLMFDNIIVLIKNDEYKILKNDQELFLASKEYLNNYINALEKYELNNKEKLLNENDLLLYLRNNPYIRRLFKEKFDNDLIYIREHYPEYLRKWKYYQEFEKLCEND
ncbi:DUF2972 domain-containing protein [Campylobacter lari]|nr:DUF2972 domain-containing protein [Campylobacter lari]